MRGLYREMYVCNWRQIWIKLSGNCASNCELQFYVAHSQLQLDRNSYLIYYNSTYLNS